MVLCTSGGVKRSCTLVTDELSGLCPPGGLVMMLRVEGREPSSVSEGWYMTGQGLATPGQRRNRFGLVGEVAT